MIRIFVGALSIASFMLVSVESEAPEEFTGSFTFQNGACLKMPNGNSFCAYVPPRP